MKSSEIALVLSANPNAVFRITKTNTRSGTVARILQTHDRQVPKYRGSSITRREVTYTVEYLQRLGFGDDVRHEIHRHYKELRPQDFQSVVEGKTLEALAESYTENLKRSYARQVAEHAHRHALVSGIMGATTLDYSDLCEVPDKVLQVLSDALTVKAGA